MSGSTDNKTSSEHLHPSQNEATNHPQDAMETCDQTPKTTFHQEYSPSKQDTPTKSRLSRRQVVNLASLVLAYACVICSTTLVVGTSAVVVLSVGGTSQSSPFALGMFFMGSACISLFTLRIFQHRTIGFMVGVSLGILGALLGAIAVVVSSSILVILASMPLGAANGIGFYLRFAAVEVVPIQHKSLAVTLVLTGGVIAAFVGPETAQVTRDLFGNDLLYLGTYMMIGVFNLLNACFILVVKFPPTLHNDIDEDSKESSSRSINTEESLDEKVTLKSLILTSSFLVPCAMATASWCIMAMPMSIVRVAMAQVGFTSRQSLTTIELHFLGMYGPGFVTGKIINRFGAYMTSLLSILCFLLATIINLLSDTSENGSLATWILGLCLVGLGWNLGFSSATVLLTRVYAAHFKFKARVQAINDFVMFLVSGGTTFSTGYIYNAGGGMMDGWRTVNYVVLGMIGVISVIIVPAYIHERKQPPKRNVTEESDEETPTAGNAITESSSPKLPTVISHDDTGVELATCVSR